MALPASDSFASPNGTTITAHSAGWNNATGQIVINNERINSNTASWSLTTAYWIADLFNSNHYSQAIFYHNNGSGSNSTGVGCNLQGTVQGYIFMGNFGNCFLYRVNSAGSLTQLSTAGAGIPNGATIRIENVDGLITCYINGSTVGAPPAVTDTTYSGGSAGVVFQQSGTYAQLDNWVGGNVSAGPSEGLPVYETDLVDINLADNVTDWDEINGGAGLVAVNSALAMQGGNCIGRVIDGEGGIIYNPVSAITIPSNFHLLVWGFVASPLITNNLGDRGVCVIVGTDAANQVKYHVDGKNTYGASGRVGKCYAVDYTVRTNNPSDYPYRTLTGTPAANPNLIGMTLNLTVPNTSINLGVDAIRMGTGLFITGGEAATPATFQGMADINDGLFARYGLLTNVSGGFELQGKFAIGQNPTQVATSAYFDDADRTITIIDSPHSAANFTNIIIDHANTYCRFSNISFLSLGVNNKGQINVTTADPVFDVIGGIWAGLGLITLRSNSTIDATIFRQCETVTANGASISNARFDRAVSASALVVASLANISNNKFISSGTGHAVEITSLGGGSMIWQNTTEGYAATDGSTGNEAVFVNVASGTLNISVAAGYTAPSVRTAGATVNIIAGQQSFNFSVNPAITGYEWRLYVDSGIQGEIGTVELAGEESATQSSQSYTYTPSGQNVALQIMASGYLESVTYYTLGSSDQNITINLESDIN